MRISGFQNWRARPSSRASSLTIGVSQYSLGEFKIGGALCDKVMLGKDLVSDILPPPEYIIEAYLETSLLAKDPQSISEHRKRLTELKKDYDSRHEYWAAQDIDPQAKSQLLQKAHEPAQRFWQLLETSFYPAVEKKDVRCHRGGFSETDLPRIRSIGPQSMKRFSSQIRATTGSLRSRTQFARNVSFVLIFLSCVVLALVFADRLGQCRLCILKPLHQMCDSILVACEWQA